MEKPILFSGPMVRAILEGRKTQTRRVIKPQPEKVDMGFAGEGLLLPECPYGHGRLWVRETWGLWDTIPSDGPERARVFYRATDEGKNILRHQLWRPSIFMPRWAARITLDVVNVRVERLHEIDGPGAEKEGVTLPADELYPCINRNWKLRAQFEKLWDGINGKKHPWNSNPWVWVIEFTKN